MNHRLTSSAQRMRKLNWLLAPFVALALSQFAWGSIQPPIRDYLPKADTIYLVRTDSIHDHHVTFDVTMTLRGKPLKRLVLVCEILEIHPGSEFLISSSAATRNGHKGDVVGDLMKGNLGWLYAHVSRDPEGITLDGIPIEQIKRLLKQNP